MNQQELCASLKRFQEQGDSLGSSILTEEAATGKKIPEGHLRKISQWTRSDIPAELLHTYPVLMIDTAPTRNNVLYTEVSQKKSIKGWRGITYLFNDIGGAGGSWFQADHTLQAASQKARIYESRLVSTPKGEIGSLAWFYAVEDIDEATNSFIKKLDAGILREVSIHVTVPEGVICSICNAPFGECEKNSGTYHWPGDKYGKKTCYMSTGEGVLVPLELSSVACPGSVNAHVMKDDDVENYPVVSLKEALGGSRQALYSISREADVKTKKTKEEIAEELKRVQEMAATAGVSLAEAATTAGITLEERVPKKAEKKECSECGHESHGKSECKEEGCECSGSSKQSAKKDDAKDKDEEEEGKGEDEEKEADPPEDDDTKDKKNKKAAKQNAKPKFSLFEGECVACGRTEHAAPTDETEKIKAMRTSFQEQVTEIVAKAKEKCEAAEAKAGENAQKAAHFDKFFENFVAETVDLAITAGHKKSHEKQAYHDSLKSLSYEAVREIHDVFKLKPADKSAEKARLEQSMVERHKDNLGRTQIVEDKDGVKRTKPERRAFFAAK